ncbi:Polyketide synthase, enoylreductase domain [Phytophthora cactorum]|nr:Polyketide synthase, enoylreductase domain [Phytophthora cactorum]
MLPAITDVLRTTSPQRQRYEYDNQENAATTYALPVPQHPIQALAYSATFMAVESQLDQQTERADLPGVPTTWSTMASAFDTGVGSAVQLKAALVEPNTLVAAGNTGQRGHIVVKNKYLGVNATDINVTNGVFNENPPPFGTGLDAAGTVVEVGQGVTEVKVGDFVVYDKFGAYAEYVEVPIGSVHELPELSPAALPLTVCGISASIAIKECGELKTNETVFVTASAGGAGQFVVQLAKMAGNHVIGTCSNDEKVAHLKKLGCDRVINYNKENIDEVLKKEYPKGIDIAFETIGGEMFKTVFDNMAIRGRIIVFGHISEYRGDTPRSPFTVSAMNEVLLMKAITVRGFLLRTYADIIPTHMADLFKLIKEGKLLAGVDPTEFHGLEQVPDAIDHMYAHKNIGKVVVELP